MYDIVIELDPYDKEAYFQKGLYNFYEIGNCLNEIKLNEEAIEMMDKVIELDP